MFSVRVTVVFPECFFVILCTCSLGVWKDIFPSPSVLKSFSCECWVSMRITQKLCIMHQCYVSVIKPPCGGRLQVNHNNPAVLNKDNWYFF